MKSLLHGAILAFALGMPYGAWAHEPHECPADLPDAPVLTGHIEQGDILAGDFRFDEIVEIGRELFTTLFNTCDGQGRPETTGAGEHRIPGQPAFIRTSSPDSNSCAGCHTRPRIGGAGEFLANVFVLAQALDPVTESVAAAESNERNPLGLFGSGAIEMLGREMTDDLQAQAAGLGDGTHQLTTKGVVFEVTIDGGVVVASEGIDTDLIVKPFHQAGVVRSLREFTVNAMNHHHGMQAEERFDLNADKGFDDDYDNDGVSRELTIGDITAATLFQAALAVPGRLLPADPVKRREIDRGEQIFSDIGCASCHKPQLVLDSAHFVEPYSRNPLGTFSDASQVFTFDMTKEGEKPTLERARGGGAIVRAYTDLKRHNLCDPESDPDPIRYFCNEQLAQGRPDQDGRPGSEFFITRKLWDVGSSAPYGHRGDLTTITEAILAHGGEARGTRDQFVALTLEDQAAVVDFLKTLRVLPSGSPRVKIQGN